jgi:hypothetical protein
MSVNNYASELLENNRVPTFQANKEGKHSKSESMGRKSSDHSNVVNFLSINGWLFFKSKKKETP